MVATIAPWKTSRGRGSEATAGSTGPASKRGGEERRIGDVGGVEDVAREPPHPLGERRRAGEDQIGAGGEALLGGAKPLPVDPLLGRDVVDAVVDDKRRIEHVAQLLGLRRVSPEDRVAHPEPPRGAADLGPQQAPVEGANGGAAVEREHERREHMQAVGRPCPAQAAHQAAADAAQVARGELGAAQAERLDEEHAVGPCQPAHQLVLVDRQLGRPVGRADADDVAPFEFHRRQSLPVATGDGRGLRDHARMELTLPTHDGTPTLPRRLLQALALKRGWMQWDARLAPTGEAAGPPRLLLRVDEFPHARAFDPGGHFGTDAFRRFHAVLAEAGTPYLLAITPRVSREYLDPGVEEWRPLEDAEVETMRELAAEGVVFALHGLDHRTRHASPRRHSELCGLDRVATEKRIDAALRSFAELGLETPVFVAPFNRFDATQYDVLAERFESSAAGPRACACSASA